MTPSRRNRLIELAERIDQLRAELAKAEAEMVQLMEGRQRHPSSSTMPVAMRKPEDR